MSRFNRLGRPETRAPHWKAALPLIGLAAVCIGLSACAGTEQKPKVTAHDADYSHCPAPVWPKADLDARHTGTVTLKYLIGENGEVQDSIVLKSTGYRGLDKAAQDSLAKCHFHPKERNSILWPRWVTIQYKWSIAN